ncbi:MAG: MCP four helix bundle domain-containing protein, partial [Angelakisella sp.]
MLKNMKINKRLILAFVVTVLVSSIAGIVGITLLDKIDSDYSNALIDYGFAQGDIGNLGRHFEKQRATTLYVFLSADTTSRNSYLAELAELDKTIAADMEQVHKGLVSELGKEVYAKLAAGWQSYITGRDKVILSGAKGNVAINMYKEQCTAASEEVSAIIDTMLSDKSRLGHEKSTDLTRQTINYTILMMGIIVAAFVLAVGLAISVARSISRPIAQVEKAAKEMAQGNYDSHVTYTSRDEIGSLAESMRKMTTATKSVVMDTSHVLGEVEKGNFMVEPQAEYMGVFKAIQGSILEIIRSLNSTMAQIN